MPPLPLKTSATPVPTEGPASPARTGQQPRHRARSDPGPSLSSAPLDHTHPKSSSGSPVNMLLAEPPKARSEEESSQSEERGGVPPKRGAWSARLRASGVGSRSAAAGRDRVAGGQRPAGWRSEASGEKSPRRRRQGATPQTRPAGGGGNAPLSPPSPGTGPRRAGPRSQLLGLRANLTRALACPRDLGTNNCP